jgi:DNA-binding MarR family transcriptional regulator
MRLDSLSDTHAKRLRACPPSPKLVYITLANEGALTQKQLVTETMMPKRTVWNALEHLTEAGLATAQSCPYAARKRMYQITSAGRDPEL